jgi:uncharacterized Fe-S cluster-containing MiaB family protein
MRGRKNRVDPHRPYAWLVEPERTAEGAVEDVATVFLTNRECPFRCIYCDLWKNTTDSPVPVGAIPQQIDFALAQLPAARHVKLYNSGNFFDRQAIPTEDYSEIARRVCGFRTVIVENHPRLCDQACVSFRDLLVKTAQSNPACGAGDKRDATSSHDATPQLEIALGLETVHPDILPHLNKRMTAADFRRACEFLRQHDIALRAFILLKPPCMPEGECVEWAMRSVEYAFDCGVRVCCVIPTRSDSGIMERLQQDRSFAPPRLGALEAVSEQGIGIGRGRVFVDTWDIERFFDCPRCGPARADRLRKMNLTQEVLPAITCACT